METSKELEDAVLEYLSAWRLRLEVMDNFNISNVQSWHLIKWLKHLGLVEELKCRVEGRKGRATYLYKSVK